MQLSVQGADSTSRTLRLSAEKLSQPLRPLLESLAAEMQTAFQTHIREAKGPDGPWPPLKPQTIAIRKHYGHPGEGPKLIRAGDLLQSLTTLRIGERSAEVGSKLSYARIVQEGGDITDERGFTRTVQAFPFVYLNAQEKDDLFSLIREYFFGGEHA